MNQNCLMLCCEFNEIEIFKYLISKRNINYLLYDNENHWNCLHVVRHCNLELQYY